VLHDVSQFVGAILWNFWTVLAGIMLGFEPVIRWFFPGYDAWAIRFVPLERRRTAARAAALVAFVIANFLAFRDVSEINRNLQTRIGNIQELPKDQMATIERLSSDLTNARGTIDQQSKELGDQKVLLNQQSKEIEKLKAPQPPRHLSEAQKQKIREIFSPVAKDFPEIIISAPAMDGNAQEYAQDFANAFKQIEGITVSDVGMLFPKSHQTPGPDLFLLVKDMNNIPPIAEKFAQKMVAAGFQIRGGNFISLEKDKFVLFIGPAQ
jgi:hypothetical protein